jgi:hypothetical protein
MGGLVIARNLYCELPVSQFPLHFRGMGELTKKDFCVLS